MRILPEDRSTTPGKSLYQSAVEEAPYVFLKGAAHIVAGREISHPPSLGKDDYGSPDRRALNRSLRRQRPSPASTHTDTLGEARDPVPQADRLDEKTDNYVETAHKQRQNQDEPAEARTTKRPLSALKARE